MKIILAQPNDLKLEITHPEAVLRWSSGVSRIEKIFLAHPNYNFQ